APVRRRLVPEARPRTGRVRARGDLRPARGHARGGCRADRGTRVAAGGARVSPPALPPGPDRRRAGRPRRGRWDRLPRAAPAEAPRPARPQAPPPVPQPAAPALESLDGGDLRG